MQDFQNKYFKRGFNMNGTDQVGSIDDDKINGSTLEQMSCRPKCVWVIEENLKCQW